MIPSIYAAGSMEVDYSKTAPAKRTSQAVS
jgi:hypothetical protein